MKITNKEKITNIEIEKNHVVIKNNHRVNGDVIAKVSGLIGTAKSIRRAKVLVKEFARYYENYEFIMRNNIKENDSVMSLRSKSQSSLEDKYRNVSIKLK